MVITAKELPVVIRNAAGEQALIVVKKEVGYYLLLFSLICTTLFGMFNSIYIIKYRTII